MKAFIPDVGLSAPDTQLAGNRRFHDVIEPATEAVLARLEEASSEQVDEAVDRTSQAQRAWAALAPGERGRTLSRIAERIDVEVDAFAYSEARNVGMPIADARGAMAGVAATFRYFAAAPERLLGRTIPVHGGVDLMLREPIGVVGLITPWNFPLTVAAWKVAPALAAGNGVVLKPSELTPLTALELERIAVEAGVPDGLLNVVVGAGPTVGRWLVDHPRIGKIAFTGSTAVGREIGRRAADTIKRVTLELGGKSPSIIFADADLRAAAVGLAGGAFGNAGQDCCARSRVFVERHAVEPFLDHLSGVVGKLRVGDPLDETTQMGRSSRRTSATASRSTSPVRPSPSRVPCPTPRAIGFRSRCCIRLVTSIRPCATRFSARCRGAAVRQRGGGSHAG